MILAHRFDWHYAPEVGPLPDGQYRKWCKWCGLRHSYRKAANSHINHEDGGAALNYAEMEQLRDGLRRVEQRELAALSELDESKQRERRLVEALTNTLAQARLYASDDGIWPAIIKQAEGVLAATTEGK